MKVNPVDRLRSFLLEYVEGFKDRYSECAVLYSGGLDSSIVAALASRAMTTTAYAVGIEGSHDLKAAAEGARELAIPLVKITAAVDDVLSACSLLSTIFQGSLRRKPDRLELSIFSPVVMAMMHVREELVFTGQGADEAFGGYSRYSSMSVAERSISMKNDLSELLEKGMDRDRAVAAHFGKTLAAPYLYEPVVSLSGDIEDRDRFSEGQNKVLLRKLAMQMGLIASSKAKKAMQYGSGFERIISREEDVLKRSGVFDFKRLH